MPSLIPCQLRYRITHNTSDFAKALSRAVRKLSTQIPIKLTGAEGSPTWMFESPRLNSMLMIMHSEYNSTNESSESKTKKETIYLVDIKYREGDRSVVEDLAALLGCVQADILADVNALDMSTNNPYTATDHLLMGARCELKQGFHILDIAFASGQVLTQNYNECLVENITELAAIRQAIESGNAESLFGKERLSQYLRTEEKPITVGENTRDYTLPHTLHIPSDGGTVLRVHYAWDPERRVHVIGYLDEYEMN
jgi:hypothetical protein